MEEVPLEDLNQAASPPPVDLAMDQASKEDCSAWEKAYKDMLAQEMVKVHRLLLSRRWILRATVDRVQVFTMPVAYSYHSFKATALFEPPFRPERLVYVMRDHNPDTRARWDDECTNVKEWETFSNGQIHIVQCECVPSLPLVWPRFVLGALADHWSPTTGVHTLVFHTTQHRYHSSQPAGKVSVKALVGATVRTLEDGTCELNLVGQVNVGDKVPTALVEQWLDTYLVKRIKLWESVVRSWTLYYGR